MSKAIKVQELRDLVNPHGADIAVLLTWWQEGDYSMVTAGTDALYADVAVDIANAIWDRVLGIQIDQGKNNVEDRRKEHDTAWDKWVRAVWTKLACAVNSSAVADAVLSNPINYAYLKKLYGSKIDASEGWKKLKLRLKIRRRK